MGVQLGSKWGSKRVSRRGPRTGFRFGPKGGLVGNPDCGVLMFCSDPTVARKY